MTINTHRVSVARTGAALPGVVMPWASLSGTGVCSAPPQHFSPVANWRAGFATRRGAASMTMPLAVENAGLPIVDIRKQYVHKTRVNVGGGGAPGPHREREPA